MFAALVKLLGGVRATVFAAAALVLLALLTVQSVRLARSYAEIERAEMQAATQRAVNEALAERAKAEIFEIRNQLAEANDEAENERDRLLAQLATGERRLRQRFSCPAAGAAPGAGGSDGAEGGGLSRADGEFLVRFAGDADAVVRQLTACQAILKTDRR